MNPDMTARPLPLVLWPDERLSTPCRPVKKVTPEIENFIHRMFVTMYREKGVGLAANQVGLDYRILVMDVDPKSRPMVLINPKIIEVRGGMTSIPEGCLSFPGETVDVQRNSTILVRAQMGVDGEEVEGWATGLASIVIQHEIDHLDGLTMQQRADQQ